MTEPVTREEVLAIRARIASIDRAVTALIAASPHPAKVLDILRKDLQSINKTSTSVVSVIAEREGERDAFLEIVKADLARTIELYEESSTGQPHTVQAAP